MLDPLRRWRRFRSLSPQQRGILLRAVLWLPAIAWALRLLGFQRSVRWLLAPARSNAPAGNTLDDARCIAHWLAVAASRGWYAGNCLSRSMTLCRLLRSAGSPAALCIGVRKNGTDLEAHAWVECSGVVVNDAPDVAERFTPLWRQAPGHELTGGLPTSIPAYWRDAADGQ